MSHWTDTIVGDRMAVDQAFTERVQASQFTSQEWGLIMTATDLEIEHAEDPDQARIVANTEAVESIIPELESIRSQMGPMAGGTRDAGDEGSGGVVDSIKGALGLSNGADDGVDQEQLAAAESLAQAYADELQQHLESKDAFEAAREAYLESADS
ncbi:hypothetical protein EGH24_04230 [Halonotius terrestris]|uniref:Uncharacterized protein n=1 Tax=Halonotius terrestris TaxID=2487750 RepID=A0A8J8PCE0_9EURY|nr:DUF5799 family protein [Halonotius terrestris]TQQ82663.1 hypothetical protein EGH24_04230 [Halonotius terrestris]